MPTPFEEALLRNPAPPRVLGDVRLTYDPPLLVGKGISRHTLVPTALLVAGVALGICTLAAFFLTDSALVLATLVLGTGACFIGNLFLEQRAVRSRVFVCHFAEKTLRLDYATRVAGLPRTLQTEFEGIKSVQIVQTLNGMLALTVDLVPTHGSPQLLREVLIAFVPAFQKVELERVAALLQKAVAPGLKLAEPEVVAEPGVPPEPVDTFVP